MANNPKTMGNPVKTEVRDSPGTRRPNTSTGTSLTTPRPPKK